MQRILSALCSGLLILGCAGNALAEGFALSDWGARGTALGGGMVGRANDPSAVAHNPAGITQLPGQQMMGGSTVITPMGTVDTIDARSGKRTSTKVNRNWWVNPHLFYTHQYNDDMWFGMGVFSRFGLGNSYDGRWPGRVNLIDVSLRTVSFNPNVAYKVTDNLSLALGIDFMVATMKMHKDTPMMRGATFLGYNNQELSGKSLAVGFNAAAHYTFNEQWAAGLTYRSRVRHQVSGESDWRYQVPGSPMQDSNLRGNLDLPDVISFGITYKPVENMSFEVGSVYTVWSQYRNFNIHLEGPAWYTADTPKNWHDNWSFNASVEYKPLDWLALRGGYVFETSPMDQVTMDYMTPSDGRHRFSTGVGFEWDQWTLDLAYSYIKIKPINYDKSLAPGVLDGGGHSGDSHVMAVTVGYKF